jgi:hypothetical protein
LGRRPSRETWGCRVSITPHSIVILGRECVRDCSVFSLLAVLNKNTKSFHQTAVWKFGLSILGHIGGTAREICCCENRNSSKRPWVHRGQSCYFVYNRTCITTIRPRLILSQPRNLAATTQSHVQQASTQIPRAEQLCQDCWSNPPSIGSQNPPLRLSPGLPRKVYSNIARHSQIHSLLRWDQRRQKSEIIRCSKIALAALTCAINPQKFGPGLRAPPPGRGVLRSLENGGSGRRGER